MRKHGLFSVSAIAFLFCLFLLPIRSHADPLQYQAGSMHSFGHGIGWLAATQAPRANTLLGVVNFDGDRGGFSGTRGGIVAPRTHVGAAPFGFRDGTGYHGVYSDSENDPDPVSTPEPPTYLLLGIGLMPLILLHRFGRQAGQEA
jgi:hypothetical protein